ncbi:MAG: FkbM family methyltransferase [Paracoccaceae bacterium]
MTEKEPGARYVDLMAGIDAEIAALSKELESELTRKRGKLNALIWRLQKAKGAFAHYFSDSGQDYVVDNFVFKGKEAGTFVEVGAFDGVQSSACMYFEMVRGWSGLVIEANPQLVKKAQLARKSEVIEAVVSEAGVETEFLMVDTQREFAMLGGIKDTLPKATVKALADGALEAHYMTVKTRRLGDILEAKKLSQIDLLTLDIQGAELGVLQSIPFDKFDITAICVKNQNSDDSIAEVLYPQGYVLADYLGFDELYVKEAVQIENMGG